MSITQEKQAEILAAAATSFASILADERKEIFAAYEHNREIFDGKKFAFPLGAGVMITEETDTDFAIKTTLRFSATRSVTRTATVHGQPDMVDLAMKAAARKEKEEGGPTSPKPPAKPETNKQKKAREERRDTTFTNAATELAKDEPGAERARQRRKGQKP